MDHRVARSAAVIAVLLVAACGRSALSIDGETPAQAEPNGSAGSASPTRSKPTRCRVASRFTPVAGLSNNFLVAAAVQRARFALLWLDEATPWRLMYQPFSLSGGMFGDPISVSQVQLRPKAALVALPDAFVAAWVDDGSAGDRIRVSVFFNGVPRHDLTIADSIGGDAPSLARSDDGRLVLSYTRTTSDGGFERVATSSDDGVRFSEPVVIYSGKPRPTFASSIAMPGGVAHTWVSRDNHHETVDMAAGTDSFVIISDDFVYAENQIRVYVRQIGLDGKALFDPVRVSSDDEPAGTNNSQEPRIVALGNNRYLAMWGEREWQGPHIVYVIRAGLVDCSSDRG